jgi:hypothetical protein
LLVLPETAQAADPLFPAGFGEDAAALAALPAPATATTDAEMTLTTSDRGSRSLR